MKQKQLPVIIIGGGGHARVVADALLAVRAQVLGYTDPSGTAPLRIGESIRHLGGDDVIREQAADQVLLANGVGGTVNTAARQKLFERFKELGYSFVNVIHPAAVIAHGVRLGEAAQVMAGAVIQTGTVIEENVIINTRSSVDHDCRIGAHTHIAPGAVLCGGVKTGKSVFVGAGAVVTQGVELITGQMVKARGLATRGTRKA